jgi:hypothetical protein
MTTLAEIIPDPDTALSLEPEELAGVALELLTSSGPNEPSIMNPASFTSIQTIGHPAIVKACWSAFLRGDYDTAVFQTFKELEVAIREADSLGLTETVVTMAGLSKFVVVDLSGSSVPAELHSILGQIKKPVLAFGELCAIFPDLEDQTSVITIEGDDTNLLAGLEDNLPALERLHTERIIQLAKRYTKAEKAR